MSGEQNLMKEMLRREKRSSEMERPGSSEMGERDNSEAEQSWIRKLQERVDTNRPLVSTQVSIYRISSYIKQFQPEAYIPQFVPLGPYYRKISEEYKMEPESEEYRDRCIDHRGDLYSMSDFYLSSRRRARYSRRIPQLSLIDEYKMEAVRRTLPRLNLDGKALNLFVNHKICLLDSHIRGCYEETIEYSEKALAWMLTVDSCFCLEFFRASFRTNDENDFSIIFQSEANKSSTWWQIKKDIFKLENQIPLSVLVTILQRELWSHYEVAKRVIQMLLVVSEIPFNFSPFYSREVVEYVVRRHIIKDVDDKEYVMVRASHLLDLYTKVAHGLLTVSNRFLQGNVEDEVEVEVDRDLILPAADLEKAGIKFEGSNMGEVRFERRGFGRAILVLPKMYIDEDREPFLRNLMAFEDRHLFGERRLFCNFMVFMDYLIDRESDVALLREHGIIKSGMGSSKELAVMFNTLCRGFHEDCGPFKPILRQIIQHYNNPVNKWIHYFRKNYCSTPCLVVSLLAATLLLCFTAVQTVFTIIKK